MQRWQRGDKGSSGGSAVAAASLTAEAAAWQKRDFGGSSSVLGSMAAAWRQWRQHGIGSGSVAYADDDYNGDDSADWLLIASPSRVRGGRGRRINQASIQCWSHQGTQAGRDDLLAATARHLRDCRGLPLLLLPPPQAAGGGERAGRMCCRRSPGYTAMAMAIATVWGKKGLDKGGRGEGESKDGFVFSCCLILLLCFWLTLFNAGLDRLLLQDFSSSCPNLVITFLFGNHSVRVNCGKKLYSALAQDRVANFLRSSLLISYWLLGFVFAS